MLGPGRESTVARVREQLDRARRDKHVRAVVLRIDTPGGSVTASDIVYSEIERFKRDRSVPLVAQLMGTATSGGYYIAMAADEVVAHPTTVTGSIGVIFLGVNFSGLMEKLGIKNQTITAGVHKDAGSPLRAMTPDERAHFQSVIDDLHERFREVVAAGRPKLDAATIEILADGRIYSASQALENGLVDRVASLDETLDSVKESLGEDEVRVVRYHRPREWRRNIYTEPPSSPPVLRIDWTPLLGPFDEPGFHYLWWPGGS
jgi:protease-4